MKTKPSASDFSIAVDWLQCNEGDDGESEACEQVALWLNAQIEALEFFAEICKELNVTPARARELLKRPSRV